MNININNSSTSIELQQLARKLSAPAACQASDSSELV